MHVHNSPSDRNCWATPPDLFKVLDDEFSFVADMAASKDNRKCKRFYSAEDNALACSWPKAGALFCNPPYSRADNKGSYGLQAWLQKAYETATASGHPVVVLTPCDPSTKWWSHAYPLAKEIRICTPRVHFVPPPGVKASQPPATTAVWVFTGQHARRPMVLWDWKEEICGE